MAIEKKKRELNEMQKAFLDALFSNECAGDPVLAKKKAGYADSITTKYLIETLHEEIVDLAKKVLAANSGRAVYALINVLVDPSSAGAANQLKAAESILSRAGVKEKEDTQVSTETGIVILPAKRVTVTVENDDSPAT